MSEAKSRVLRVELQFRGFCESRASTSFASRVSESWDRGRLASSSSSRKASMREGFSMMVRGRKGYGTPLGSVDGFYAWKGTRHGGIPRVAAGESGSS